MNHLSLPLFWRHYQQLPEDVQKLADKSFKLLKAAPEHPSLCFKKVGGRKHLWSARVGMHYRGPGRGEAGRHRLVLDRHTCRVR